MKKISNAFFPYFFVRNDKIFYVDCKNKKRKKKEKG